MKWHWLTAATAVGIGIGCAAFACRSMQHLVLLESTAFWDDLACSVLWLVAVAACLIAALHELRSGAHER